MGRPDVKRQTHLFGITAAWALHFAAVSSHARRPAGNCHNLYRHQLLADPITVRGGLCKIPESPGLGYEIAWEAVEVFQIDPIAKPYPHPYLLIQVASSVVADDGSPSWRERLERASPKPSWVMRPN